MSFQDRIIRAAKLDVSLYEEVEADKGALPQAMGVVVLSSVAAGLGSIERAGLSAISIGTITALIGWYVWAYITYFIGVRLSFLSLRPKRITVPCCELSAFQAPRD